MHASKTSQTAFEGVKFLDFFYFRSTFLVGFRLRVFLLSQKLQKLRLAKIGGNKVNGQFSTTTTIQLTPDLVESVSLSLSGLHSRFSNTSLCQRN